MGVEWSIVGSLAGGESGIGSNLFFLSTSVAMRRRSCSCIEHGCTGLTVGEKMLADGAGEVCGTGVFGTGFQKWDS